MQFDGLLTVVIIAADDGSHEPEYMEMEQAIINTKFNKEVRYIILKYNTKTDKAVSKKLQKNEFDRICFEEKSEEKASKKGFYKPEMLTEFLAQFKEVSKDHRFILITWGHGAGLGFFNTIDDLPGKHMMAYETSLKEKQTNALRKNIEQISILGVNLGFSENIMNDTANNVIKRTLESVYQANGMNYPHLQSVKEQLQKEHRLGVSAVQMAAIIKNSIGVVEMMICMNCFLQMIETGFYLKDSVKVMVAAQKSLPFNGYNYQRLFKLLNKSPSATPKEISDNIITYFPLKYYNQPYKYKDDDGVVQVYNKPVHISSNDLTKYSAIMDEIRQFVERLKKIDQNNFPAFLEQVVRPARQRCYDLTSKSVDVIDLTSFFEFLIAYAQIIDNYTLMKDLMLIVRSMLSRKRSMVLASYCSPLNFEVTDNALYRFSSPKSLSMFFPDSAEPLVDNFKTSLYGTVQPQNHFLIATHWNVFLHMAGYLTKTGDSNISIACFS